MGDGRAEGAVIETYAYGCAMLLAYGNQFGELASGHVVVAVEVSGIDADLLDDRSHGNGSLG